ncbi:MAG TPA: adenosylcobinamide-GDP ribazoletransferase [Geobacteraceae bacterium]|nr:adenosylcobinamide-GDP ribazoletransferase [Geobacteraceae bacterium]
MRLYLIAIQFLTIIPLPFSFKFEEGDLGRSMSLFPLAGLTLGAVLAGTDYILSAILPRDVADLLLVAFLAVITGVLHLDGLADVCDGFAARGGRERFLAVMKDSWIGAAGAVGLVLTLLLKYEALLHIPAEMKRDALFCFPMMARFAQVQMTVGSSKARNDGLGSSFILGAGWRQLLFAVVTTIAFSFFLLGIRGLWLFIAAYLFTWVMKARFHKKLGGITGDIIGFANELNETLCLLILVAMSGTGGAGMNI